MCGIGILLSLHRRDYDRMVLDQAICIVFLARLNSLRQEVIAYGRDNVLGMLLPVSSAWKSSMMANRRSPSF
jgi:hypothetical protein